MDEKVAALTEYLQDLRLTAGMPSSRMIRDKIRTGGVRTSHTTVNDILKGVRLSAWPLVQSVTWALEGDLDQARALWEEAHGVRMVSHHKTRHEELLERLDRIDAALERLSPAETPH